MESLRSKKRRKPLTRPVEPNAVAMMNRPEAILREPTLEERVVNLEQRLRVSDEKLEEYSEYINRDLRELRKLIRRII